MAHDAGFLAKCEQFLLHPTVRTLSLAQRVDFLEKKGLSPEEITACLKNIERQNGLSRVLLNTASATTAAAGSTYGALPTSSSSFSRNRALATLWKLVRSYGLATAATLLIAYGYVRFRQNMAVQLLLTQRQEQVKQREKRHTTVLEMLALVSEQRKQYEEVVDRVKVRITRLQKLKKTGLVEPVNAAEKVQQQRRHHELQTLKDQVATLKDSVFVTYETELTNRVQKETEKAIALENVNGSALQKNQEEKSTHSDLATEEELLDEKPLAPMIIA